MQSAKKPIKGTPSAMDMARNIKRLKQKSSKKAQARLLCDQLRLILGVQKGR